MKAIYSRIQILLASTRRRSVLILLGLIIIGTLFEVMGIGLLLPVIGVLLEDNLAISFPVLEPLLIALGNPDHQTQIQITMAVLIAAFLVKNLFLAFLAWWQARFTMGVQVDLSQTLFSIYLRQPYTFHLQRNSAQLIRNITGEVGYFIAYVLNPALILIAEVTVLLGIVALLLAVEPLGTLIVFLVLFTVAWIFHRATRTRITRWGETRQHHDGLRIQHLNQGLGGAKDVKLLGREAEFLVQFQEHNSKSAQMNQFMEIVQKLPRLWLEILAVVGLALLVFSMLAQGREMSSIVPTAGLFAAAAFRLLPSAIRILAAAQYVRYAVPVINNLYEDLELSSPEPEAKLKATSKSGELRKEICLTGVKYQYDGAPTSAIADISINIQQGESIGFIGPSGSGKSTLIDVILGLLTPDSGLVSVDGNDIQLELRAWQDQIGYVPQSIYLTDDTLRRNIAFGLPDKQINDIAVNHAIDAAGLEDFVSSLPEGIETIVGERGVRLSGGQRQRIGIARAMYHDPDVLVLDEATSALDTASEYRVMQAVMALHGKKTIIIVAHRLSTVEHCDRLYRLEQGKVVEEGIPSEIIPSLNITSSN